MYFIIKWSRDIVLKLILFREYYWLRLVDVVYWSSVNVKILFGKDFNY